MRAEGITLRDLFQHERRHVVPLYQRPYVWEQESRWDGLATGARAGELLEMAVPVWSRPLS